MAISMYRASIPVFARALDNLANNLRKGETHAKYKAADPDSLLQQRLIFDMLPLVKQVQIACDTAAQSAARLAGVEAKHFPDTETTLADAYKRIEATNAYLHSFKPEQIDGCEGRTITMKMRSREATFNGLDYLFNFALPNFYFHCTTAYDILRVAGADIGKRDYLGI